MPAQAGLWGGSLVPPLSGGTGCQLLGGRCLFLLLWESLVGGLGRETTRRLSSAVGLDGVPSTVGSMAPQA